MLTGQRQADSLSGQQRLKGLGSRSLFLDKVLIVKRFPLLGAIPKSQLSNKQILRSDGRWLVLTLQIPQQICEDRLIYLSPSLLYLKTLPVLLPLPNLFHFPIALLWSFLLPLQSRAGNYSLSSRKTPIGP